VNFYCLNNRNRQNSNVKHKLLLQLLQLLLNHHHHHYFQFLFNNPIFQRSLHIRSGPQRSSKEHLQIADAESVYRPDALPVMQPTASPKHTSITKLLLSLLTFLLTKANEANKAQLQAIQVKYQ